MYNNVIVLLLLISIITNSSCYLLNCSDDESLFLSSIFKNIGAGKGWMMDYSGCPNDPWIKDFAEMSQMTNDKHDSPFHLLMNVGFNKGYNFANWLNIFTPWNNINAIKWYHVAKDAKLLTDSDVDCGFCDDCKVIYDYPIIPKKELIIIGIDINELNHHMVNKTYELLSRSNNNVSLVSIYLVHAGASSNVGTTKVFKCKFGDELCKLPDENTGLSESAEMISLPLVTVESSVHDVINENKRSHPLLHDIMQKVYHSHPINIGLNHSEFNANATDMRLIDILLIDVEGFDPLVIQGTRHLLKYRAIRVVRFEYNCVGPWKNIELKDIVQEFDSFGYDCFFEGQERLWYISGQCWHSSSWEFKQWSNVMCVNRNDPWLEVARKYVVTRQSLLSSYEGKLIKMRSQKDVFLVENGTKRLFMSADAFLNRGYEWSNIVAVDSGITNILLPTGANLE